MIILPLDIILGGDFNLPHILWLQGNAAKGATPSERKMMKVIGELSIDLSLSQIINTPTHKDGNILDLVFINNMDLVHDININMVNIEIHISP